MSQRGKRGNQHQHHQRLDVEPQPPPTKRRKGRPPNISSNSLSSGGGVGGGGIATLLSNGGLGDVKKIEHNNVGGIVGDGSSVSAAEIASAVMHRALGTCGNCGACATCMTTLHLHHQQHLHNRQFQPAAQQQHHHHHHHHHHRAQDNGYVINGGGGGGGSGSSVGVSSKKSSHQSHSVQHAVSSNSSSSSNSGVIGGIGGRSHNQGHGHSHNYSHSSHSQSQSHDQNRAHDHDQSQLRSHSHSRSSHSRSSHSRMGHSASHSHNSHSSHSHHHHGRSHGSSASVSASASASVSATSSNNNKNGNTQTLDASSSVTIVTTTPTTTTTTTTTTTQLTHISAEVEQSDKVNTAELETAVATTSGRSNTTWHARSVADIKMSSIYNRSSNEAPAELYRKDLISAMKLPDSEQLASYEYLIVNDQWKQEWEKGVQVPVNPDSLPEPCVYVLSQPLVTPSRDFKLPKNRFLRITKDETYSSELHCLTNVASLAEHSCAYDIDRMDSAWLKLHNIDRVRYGATPIKEQQFERVFEELENGHFS